MRASRVGSFAVDEVDAGASISGLAAPGYYGDGIGSYGDGIAEPIVMLASHGMPGRTARRRSLGGQLKREARSQLAGLGYWGEGYVNTAIDYGGKAASTYVATKTGGAVQMDIDHNGVSVGAGPIIPGVIDGQTVFTTKDGQKVQLSPEAIAQIKNVQTAMAQAQAGAAAAFSTCKGNVVGGVCQGTPAAPTSAIDMKAILAAKAKLGKGAIPLAKKKSKVVPIVAGVAAVGLLAWLL